MILKRLKYWDHPLSRILPTCLTPGSNLGFRLTLDLDDRRARRLPHRRHTTIHATPPATGLPRSQS